MLVSLQAEVGFKEAAVKADEYISCAGLRYMMCACAHIQPLLYLQ